jgi:xylose isomerase
MTARVRGIEGVEVVYPQDFTDMQESIQLIKQSALPVAAVNLNVKSEKKWQIGSFTSNDPGLRREAVAYLKTAMELAADLGSNLVTCCPLIDGHNYSFEVDYVKQWQWLFEGIGEGAQHRRDVRLSLEYKLNEARNYVILGDMGRTLYFCEKLGLPNVGVTLDTGHAYVAKETPAEMLCLAAEAGRLFYVHFNDNAREWDWDMLPGSVALWDLVEFLFYLDRLQWSGWACYDVLTRDADPVETMDATITIMETTQQLLDKIGRERLAAMLVEGIPARSFEHLMRSLL